MVVVTRTRADGARKREGSGVHAQGCIGSCFAPLRASKSTLFGTHIEKQGLIPEKAQILGSMT